MPGHEETLNLPLNGEELKAIILRDAQRLVDNECMLMANVAFPRVSYVLTLKLHMANPFFPESGNEIQSKAPTPTELQSNPALSSVEPPPLLNVQGGGEVGATSLTRTIDSGNAERLRNGMGIPCLVPQNDGTKSQESIVYPPGSFPELGEGDVHITDTTAQVRAEMGLVGEPQDIVVE